MLSRSRIVIIAATLGHMEISVADVAYQDHLLAIDQFSISRPGKPAQQGILNVGGRVYVRFDHGSEALAAQWYRQGRQLFLARFNV